MRDGAPVHVEDLPRDEARLLRTQEDDRAGDVVRMAVPLEELQLFVVAPEDRGLGS